MLKGQQNSSLNNHPAEPLQLTAQSQSSTLLSSSTGILDAHLQCWKVNKIRLPINQPAEPTPVNGAIPIEHAAHHACPGSPPALLKGQQKSSLNNQPAEPVQSTAQSLSSALRKSSTRILDIHLQCWKVNKIRL
jgi:hypothetical protein